MFDHSNVVKLDSSSFKEKVIIVAHQYNALSVLDITLSGYTW